MNGIMVANKNCNTCHGEGYYKLLNKNRVSQNNPCQCLRPLVKSKDISELKMVLKEALNIHRKLLALFDREDL